MNNFFLKIKSLPGKINKEGINSTLFKYLIICKTVSSQTSLYADLRLRV